MTRSGRRSSRRPRRPTRRSMAREQAEALHARSTGCPAPSACRSCSATSRASRSHEAARRLRWPAGTVRSRLARAREKLRRGLTRRGVVLPGAALAAVLDARSASASVSSLLCDTTTRAAIHFAAGHAAGGALSASPRPWPRRS